jgi:Tol biopolymer transport system component
MELNSEFDDGHPVLDPPRGLVYFSSTRTGSMASDVWMAELDQEGSYGQAQNVTSVNSVEVDAPDWVSPDGCRLYLSSRRDGFLDLYVAEKD